MVTDVNNIAIVCFGFNKRHVRSQPWHMADGMASGLTAQGYNVKIFTDDSEFPERDYPILALKSLFSRFRPSAALLDALIDFNPSSTFVYIGSHELLTPLRFNLPGVVRLVVCNARFYFPELLRVSLKAFWEELSLLKLPVVSSLIPGWLLAQGYKRSGATDVIYISSAAQVRYSKLGLPVGRVLLPAVDKKYLSSNGYVAQPKSSDRVICYFGPPLQLRGIDLVIDAFEVAAEQNSNIRLKLLIRLNGEPYIEKRHSKLSNRIAISRYSARIDMVSRYMSPSELKCELDSADAFLLPFKLTVSDSPLVIIEAGLSAKPVVALRTPGVEEYVEAFGGVCAHSPSGLGDAILTALEKKSAVVDGERWVDWSNSVKPIIESILND